MTGLAITYQSVCSVPSILWKGHIGQLTTLNTTYNTNTDDNSGGNTAFPHTDAQKSPDHTAIVRKCKHSLAKMGLNCGGIGPYLTRPMHFCMVNLPLVSLFTGFRPLIYAIYAYVGRLDLFPYAISHETGLMQGGLIYDQHTQSGAKAVRQTRTAGQTREWTQAEAQPAPRLHDRPAARQAIGTTAGGEAPEGIATVSGCTRNHGRNDGRKIQYTGQGQLNERTRDCTQVYQDTPTDTSATRESAIHVCGEADGTRSELNVVAGGEAHGHTQAPHTSGRSDDDRSRGIGRPRQAGGGLGNRQAPDQRPTPPINPEKNRGSLIYTPLPGL